MEPVGFQTPVTTIVPARRRLGNKYSSRGALFKSNEEMIFPLNIDTAENEYVDLATLRLSAEKISAEYSAGSTQDQVALVKGGFQNVISRLQIRLNNSIDLIDTNQYHRFYNLVLSKAVNKEGRQDNDFMNWREGDTTDVDAWRQIYSRSQWNGQDILNYPIEDVAPVRLMTGFAPTTRYLPARLAAGAQIEVIITTSPDSDVVLPKVGIKTAAMEQPTYTVQQPQLHFDVVRVNAVTQSELAQQTMENGGIALNYYYTNYFSHVSPAASTLDIIKTNSLSRSMTGWLAVIEPIFSENMEFYSDNMVHPSFNSTAAITNATASGWSGAKNKYFEYLPLPLFGAGQYQTLVGDIKYPPLARSWRKRTYESKTWGATTATDPWMYSQSTANSFAGIRDFWEATMNVEQVMEPERLVFDAHPFWPEPTQAHWEPIANEATGEIDQFRTVDLRNSRSFSSGSYMYPERTQWVMSEYMAAVEPAAARTIQTGVDVDRVGNTWTLEVKRPSLSGASVAFPQAGYMRKNANQIMTGTTAGVDLPGGVTLTGGTAITSEAVAAAPAPGTKGYLQVTFTDADPHLTHTDGRQNGGWLVWVNGSLRISAWVVSSTWSGNDATMVVESVNAVSDFSGYALTYFYAADVLTPDNYAQVTSTAAVVQDVNNWRITVATAVADYQGLEVAMSQSSDGDSVYAIGVIDAVDTTNGYYYINGIRPTAWRFNPSAVVPALPATGFKFWVMRDATTAGHAQNVHWKWDSAALLPKNETVSHIRYHGFALEQRTVFWNNDGSISVSH